MSPKWIARFLADAWQKASWSKDPTTKVGATAVDPASKAILESGYNGLPRGVEDRPERMKRPEKYVWTGHAEENLVANAARSRLAGSTVFVTHLCCNGCARMLINAGVAKVVVGDGKTSMPPELFQAAVTMFSEAGVELVMTAKEATQAIEALATAAPDLLDAMKKIMERFGDRALLEGVDGPFDIELWPDDIAAIKEARAAIAKATGGAA